MITSPLARARARHDGDGLCRRRADVRRAAARENPLAEDFDEDYERLVAEARARAPRGGAAHYLDVRASNDALRAGAVERLLEVFSAAAGELNRAGAGLRLERTEPHRFRVGASTMVGTRLVLARGVRALTVEAGWPRAPRDGIVRGGGLACARVTHFGSPSADRDMLLLPAAGGGEPGWFVLDKSGGPSHALLADHVKTHFLVFLS